MVRSGLAPLPSRYCVALRWVSRSITNVRMPRLAAMAARLQTMVVLPTPPFWLNTTRRVMNPLPRKNAGASLQLRHGFRRAHPVPDPVRVHHRLPHRLPDAVDGARDVPRLPRGDGAQDRRAPLS